MVLLDYTALPKPCDLVLSLCLPCKMVELPRLGTFYILPSILWRKSLLTPSKRTFYQGGESAGQRAMGNGNEVYRGSRVAGNARVIPCSFSNWVGPVCKNARTILV